MFHSIKKNVTTVTLFLAISSLLVLSFVLFPISEIGIVKAESRTVVVPDDYFTITAALGNASEGDTVFVKKGTYEEHSLSINKTLTLVGEDANNTIIKNIDELDWDPVNPFPPPSPVAIQINANNVTLSGFTITCEYGSWAPVDVIANGTQIVGNIMNQSDGIIAKGNYNIIAQNSFTFRPRNTFVECSGSYNTIEYNTMVGGSGGTGLEVVGNFNIIHGNTATGGLGSFRVTGDDNTFSKNNLTESFVSDPYGRWKAAMSAQGSANIIATNRIINMGLAIEGCDNTIYGNYLTSQPALGHTITTSNNTFYLNNFVGNTTFQIGSKNEQNSWDNGKDGNYWSDYDGYDRNNDGIGDIPYSIKGIYNEPETGRDHYPLMAPVTFFDAGTWEWTPFTVNVISNSTISGFSFSSESAQIQFDVVGESNATGFCSVIIPKDFLAAQGNWDVRINEDQVTPTINEDTNSTYLYFTYSHSTKTVTIIGTTAIPEFPSWAILPLLIAATLVAIIYRKKLHNT